MVQTFQATTHQVLYCNEKINLMFLFIACSYFYCCVYQSMYTCSFLFFWLSVIIYMPLFILFISHYLHAPVYSSVYQPLSACPCLYVYQSVCTCPCLFFCLSAIICMPLFIMFISHSLHAPVYSFYQSLCSCPCLFFCLSVIIYIPLFILLFIRYYLHAPVYSSI
jgi:hypothetical protein